MEMAGTIIYLTIVFLVSMIFVVLGIFQYKAKTPVSINTGEEPPKASELTDVTKWNHKHAINFIIFGIMFFITSTAFVFALELFVNATVALILFLGAIGLEVFWVVHQHERMKKDLVKKLG